MSIPETIQDHLPDLFLPEHYQTVGAVTWTCMQMDCDGEHHVWCDCALRVH